MDFRIHLCDSRADFLLTSGNRSLHMLTNEEATRLLKRHIKNAQIRRHCIAVSEIMGKVAQRFGMNQDEWQLCGLLHDLDREEIHGDMSKHGLVAAELLENLLSRDCLHAIRAHDHRTGVTPRSIVDKALIASDAAASFLSELAERKQVGAPADMNSKARKSWNSLSRQ